MDKRFVKHNPKWLFLFLGCCSLLLFYIGLLLPGVPAIPFFLTTIYFFSRSSKRMEQWFQQSWWTRKITKVIKEKSSSKWFRWFIVSQFIVSCMVAERLFIRQVGWSICWYGMSLCCAYILFIRLKPSQASIEK
jgi:uncharacterized membrane protein YbaN (DUF454 family)